ncbi:hypothetical protein JCM8208_004286 [Rhodotorula glutinis]
MASYAALPTELVSRIAAIVHEQDQAWWHLDIERGCRCRPFGEQVPLGKGEDVPLGRWSPQYARGILALSVSARAAIAPYFRVKVLGHDLARHVQELDCLFVKPEWVVSVACALEGLPNLSSLTVDGDSLLWLRLEPHGPGEELLVQAMKSALGRITSLRIRQATSVHVVHTLEHVDQQRFRRLVVDDVETLLPITDELVDALEGLAGLVDVELDASNEVCVAWMGARLRLPHVRSLKLTYNAHESGTDYGDGLLLAHRVAPAVEVLSFDNLSDENVPPAPADLPRPLLSNLRVLRIDINDSPKFSSLRLGHLPALEHPHISSISTVGDVFPDAASFPSLPPTLRIITVDHTLALSPSPSPSLLAKCDESGIRLIARWSPPALDHARIHSDDSVPRLGWATRAPTEDDAVDLERVFGWAGARARWLLRVGDGRAMEELSAAALRLRERFVIEHS